MPILDSEILWRPASLVSDTIPAQNGGRMAFGQIVSGVKNNLFPDVSLAERAAGSIKWRKAFIHINSPVNLALLNARVFMDAPTPGGDFVLFHPGTQTDTEDQVAARPYGVGQLADAVASGATLVQVLCEDADRFAALQPFRVGDLIRVSDRPSTGGAGNEEWVTISAITYDGSTMDITVTPALQNAYAVEGTVVSSVLQVGNVAGSADAIQVTSAGGVFESAIPGNLVVPSRGAIEEAWTLTFTNATSFTASGTVTGALALGGSTTADYAPVNSATGNPYFTIKGTAWGGSFAANDTVSFSTHPASIPIWYRREVPAGTATLANDVASLAIHGESA
jgi:hypothetical protein